LHNTNVSEYMDANKAGAKWAFEIPPEPVAEELIKETIKAQLVVVGEGLSGLCTALAAREKGVDTVIITASGGPVGRGGSVCAAYSKVMERLGLPRQEVKDFYLEEFAASSFGVDQRKWYRFYKHSEEAMNWLIDMVEKDGVEVVLEDGNEDDVHSPTYQPAGTHAFVGKGVTFAGAGIMLAIKVLESNYLAAGGRVYYRTAAKQLIKDKSGRISGVIAADENGNYIKYEAEKAVVLATGDFSKNKDMMMKYCPAYAKYFKYGNDSYDTGFAVGGLFKGEGQQMALWAGAAWQRTFPNAILVQGSRLGSHMPYGSHRGLRLNINGERYCNEDCNGAYTAITVLRQPKETAFAIWGTNYAYELPWHPHGGRRGDKALPPAKVIAGWEREVQSGRLIKCDTLEELVVKLGLPKEKALSEIERYNELCRKGEDTDFYKKSKYLQEIKQAPFYGGALDDIKFFSVLGGPRTNHMMEVCDENDRPLGGLYCVGAMAGDMFANCYNFRIPGHNYGCCLTFGYLTGRLIAEL
jgi:fumarate reductase flavoprotein subunit